MIVDSILNPENYVGRSQDGAWDVALETALRQAPEDSRAEFLSQVLILQEKAGKSKRAWFDLARKVLEDSYSYERLLREGIEVADASSVRDWIECCVQRIGMRRTVRVLQEVDKGLPQKVALAEYWLPRLARTPKERSVVQMFLAARKAAKDETNK